MDIYYALRKIKMANSNKSKNKEVQSFLEDTKIANIEKYEILIALRKIILSNCNNAEEKMMYGGIMFNDFSGLFIRKNHISLEFVNGFELKDPHKHLEGTGKFRRHLKIKSIDEIKEKDVESFIKQAVKIV